MYKHHHLQLNFPKLISEKPKSCNRLSFVLSCSLITVQLYVLIIIEANHYDREELSLHMDRSSRFYEMLRMNGG